MIPLPEYALLVMAMKEKWIEFPSNETGDTVPTILIEQDGRVCYMIHVTVPTPEYAVPYIGMIHTMIPYEAIILAHEVRMKLPPKGATDADLEALARKVKKYRAGDFERLASEGKAGEHGIVDAMLVQRFEAGDATHISHFLPFLYSGKGTPFSWLYSQFDCHGQDGRTELAGSIPTTIRRAMMMPTVEDLKFKGVIRGSRKRMLQLATSVGLSRIDADPRAQLLTASHAWGNLLP
jgi:hypothetical protein